MPTDLNLTERILKGYASTSPIGGTGVGIGYAMHNLVQIRIYQSLQSYILYLISQTFNVLLKNFTF